MGRVEKLKQQNLEIEQELADMEEQVEEKIQAKALKKVESEARLEHAVRVQHDEHFLNENYLKAFCAMGSLIFIPPHQDAGFNIT